MSDERTPEHRAADDALMDALQAVVRLQCEEESLVVTEYVVIAHADSFENQERGVSTYSLITKDSGQGPHASPHHAIVGLLAYGQDFMHRSADE
jgi:uncharacterized protein (DUF924 family)